MKRLLNAGCGDHYVEDWLNVDVVKRHRADVYADLASLPFKDGCMDRIFAAHVLEHLEYHEQLPKVLGEFHRVLSNEGELCVVGPDIERAVLLGEPGATLRKIVAWPAEFNHGEWEAMIPPTGHAWTATSPLVERALEDSKFLHVSYSGKLHQIPKQGWPLGNTSDFQNGYICRKA